MALLYLFPLQSHFTSSSSSSPLSLSFHPPSLMLTPLSEIAPLSDREPSFEEAAGAGHRALHARRGCEVGQRPLAVDKCGSAIRIETLTPCLEKAKESMDSAWRCSVRMSTLRRTAVRNVNKLSHLIHNLRGQRLLLTQRCSLSFPRRLLGQKIMHVRGYENASAKCRKWR